jgi:hypothetical protein
MDTEMSSSKAESPEQANVSCDAKECPAIITSSYSSTFFTEFVSFHLSAS